MAHGHTSDTAVSASTIIERLTKHMPSAQVKAYDLTGGGDHWSVQIKASEFKGKSLIEQHQMVYAALGELMHGPIHALALDTKDIE